jgi:hypothetical protein
MCIRAGGGGQGGWAVNETGVDYPGTASIVRSPVAEGTCAGKFTVPAGSSSRGRAEVQQPQGSATSISETWEWLELIPTEANGGPHSGVLMQTKQNHNPCYNGGLNLNKDTGHLSFSTVASCSSGSKKFDLIPPPRGVWFAVKVAETFNDHGAVQVWIDPDGTGPNGYTTVLPKTHVDTATVEPVSLKWRLGLYTNLISHSETVFTDGFHSIRTG